jgi:NAD(P)-dependent dehydrogenase (short-subunit alcohol dehydrogenase family)
MEDNLSNKTYVITGATSGIGLAVMEMLAQQGASLIGVGRDHERCRKVELRLHRLYSEVETSYLEADLSQQRNVHSLANQIGDVLQQWNRPALDGLVNNAGTFTYWFTQTPEGVEMQWAVNHLAPFLLTRLLWPLLEAAPYARVVTVSSGSHHGAHINWDDPQLRRHYNGLRAYGNTKLANILFSMALNQRSNGGTNVHAFAADPGLVKTDIGIKGTPALVGSVWKLRRMGGTSPQQAARNIVFLLSDPSIQDSPTIYWKDCHPMNTSKEAMNRDNAERLWQLSKSMCDVELEV